jgi:hypothetical protein
MKGNIFCYPKKLAKHRLKAAAIVKKCLLAETAVLQTWQEARHSSCLKLTSSCKHAAYA